MNRTEILTSHIDSQGLGLEIGPCHRPAAPKRDGFNVEIVDHLTREQLLEKHKNSNLTLDQVEEVDHIWSGQPYSELTGKTKHYDWIIASHVIEHTPDLIGFLLDFDSVLKDDGVISLAIPDKRYCFDYYRPITGISKVIDHHLQGNKKNSPGTVAEYILNVVKKSGVGAWDEKTQGDHEFFHDLELAKKNLEIAKRGRVHIDCHTWCFVPHSFRLLISDLNQLGFLPFKEVSFSRIGGSEFFMTLSRAGKGLDMSRLDALKRIEDEMLEPVSRAA